MGILLALVPFIAFALLSRQVSPATALIAAMLLAALMLVRDRVRGRGLKILDVGTTGLFASLAVLVGSGLVRLDIVEVRLVVDVGLLAIVVFSLLVKRPFTLQYAVEEVPPEVAALPAFYRVNRVLSTVWAAAFAIMVGGDLILRFAPSVPGWIGVGTIAAALATAILFTRWYPRAVQRRAAPAR